MNSIYFDENGQSYACNSSNLTAEVLRNTKSSKINIPTKIIFKGESYDVIFPNDCSMLFAQNLKLTSFETNKLSNESKNIVNLHGMFSGCTALTEINISNLNTENVENMGSLFNGCKLLTKLDLSNFNTEKTIYMKAMFKDCRSLKEVIAPNFDIREITNINEMFKNCKSLEKVITPNFNENVPMEVLLNL